MTSIIEVGTSGRTAAALAKRTRDGSTPQADQNGAISRVEGEGAAVDGVPISATDAPIKIVRASSRFEIRIRPEGEGLALLKALDSVTTGIARARNAAVRAHVLADGAWLDAHPDVVVRKAWKEMWGPRAHTRHACASGRCVGVDPKTGQCPKYNPDGIYSYPIMRTVAPEVDASVITSLQKNDDAEWMGSRFDVLVKCVKAPRFYKPHQPIKIPHRVVALSVEDGGACGKLSARLQSSAVEGAVRYTFDLVARDAWQREELRALGAGEWKLGDVVISRHPVKRGRWFVRLAYTRMVERATGNATVVVRRGMRSFLVAAASGGECRAIYDGGDLIAFNKQMMARRRALGENTKRGTMGAGATGHGVKRRVGALIDLSDKEARYKAEACKRAARALVLFAKSVGAKEIVYEDFAAPKQEGVFWLLKRWPWDQLSQACQSACEAAGMPARAVIVHTDRRVCPFCEHKHAEPPVAISDGVKTWECVKCHAHRAPDQIDALDMLRVVAGGEAVERVKSKSKQARPVLPKEPK